MSLRHSLLAILTAEDMTGYDLVKYFDGTVGFLWSAPHSQIYPELRKMEAGGLISATEVPRGPKATKRVYSITPEGQRQLHEWALETELPPAHRDLPRLKAAYIEWGSYAAGRRHFQAHRAHWSDVLTTFKGLIDSIEAGAIPLLAKRLAVRPTDEHPAIVSLKRHAFMGYVYQAEAEIRWADEGLKLLDELEGDGVPIAGEAAEPVAR